MKKTNLYIVFLVLFVSILSQIVSSQGAISKIAPWLDALIEPAVDWAIKGWILSTIKISFAFFDSAYKNLPHLILANPKVDYLAPGMSFFMNILIPFYVLGITFTAFYLIFVSGSPEGRANAKGNLFKMIYSLILISLSPLLLKLLFFFSYTVTNFVLNVVDTEIGIETLKRTMDFFYYRIRDLTMFKTGEGGADWLWGVLMFTYPLLYLLLVGRYVFLTLFGMIFPFTIFLNSFYATRGLGKTLLNQLFMITFVQIVWAIALAVITIIVSTPFPGQIEIPQIHIDLANYFFFMLSPMIILGLADWFAIVVLIIDSLTTGPLCVGPVVMDELYIAREILPEEVTADVVDM